MIDGGHYVVDFCVPYGMQQFLDGHRRVIGRRVALLLELKRVCGVCGNRRATTIVDGGDSGGGGR